MTSTEHRLMPERDAAAYLGLSRSYLRNARSTGALPGRVPPPPFLRLGRLVRYERQALDEWLERHAQRIDPEAIEVCR